MFVGKFLLYFNALCATNIALAGHLGEVSKVLPYRELTVEDVKQTINFIREYLAFVQPSVDNVMTELLQKVNDVSYASSENVDESFRNATSTIENKFQKWETYAQEHFQKSVQRCLLGLALAYEYSNAGAVGGQLCTDTYVMGYYSLMSQYKEKIFSIQKHSWDLEYLLINCEDDACIQKIGQEVETIYDNLPATITDILNDMRRDVNVSTQTVEQCVDGFITEYTGKIQNLQQESYMCVVSILGEEIPV